MAIVKVYLSSRQPRDNSCLAVICSQTRQLIRHVLQVKYINRNDPLMSTFRAHSIARLSIAVFRESVFTGKIDRSRRREGASLSSANVHFSPRWKVQTQSTALLRGKLGRPGKRQTRIFQPRTRSDICLASTQITHDLTLSKPRFHF